MLIKLLLGLVLLYFVFKWIHRYQRASLQQRKQLWIQGAVLLAAAAILIGVATGRMHWAGALVAGALPFLRRGAFLLTRLLPFWIQKTGGKAHFSTEHLDLEVDIAKKAVKGTVLKGPHEGKTLAELSPQQLAELADYYQERDKKSYYFIRVAQKGFQEHATQQPDLQNPDRLEALQILGLSGNPSKEEIISAHRRLINKLHPDRGGSDFLASRVNQARDVLLDERV